MKYFRNCFALFTGKVSYGLFVPLFFLMSAVALNNSVAQSMAQGTAQRHSKLKARLKAAGVLAVWPLSKSKPFPLAFFILSLWEVLT